MSERQEQIDSVLAEVKARALETIRVVFSDQHGILRGKTIVANALPSAFRNGIAVPSTLLLKDTSHRTAFEVWAGTGDQGPEAMLGAGDVVLRLDPAHFYQLPWAPHSAWILCDVCYGDGSPFPYGSRSVLKVAEDALAAHGLRAKVGLEVEFNVFALVDPSLGHAQTTMPGAPPETRALAQGFQYLTDAKYNEVEGLLDTLRRTAQAMDMPVRSVEIEMGPGQFEFTFDPDDPMVQADRMVLFRTMVKELCATKGLHASFMAKPRLENVAANGWHIHQSVLNADGQNLFVPEKQGELNPLASAWIAGLLNHAHASSLLIAPTVNSYKRYVPYQLAPNRVCWGWDNRGAMLRALGRPQDMNSRIENRAADSSVNPHFALAAQLIGGLDGMTQGRSAPAPTEEPYAKNTQHLPATLGDAIAAFDSSAVYRKAFGDGFVDYLVRLKRFEWDRYLSSISEWEQAEYFSLF